MKYLVAWALAVLFAVGFLFVFSVGVKAWL